MYFHRSRIQTEGFDLEPQNLLLLQLGEIADESGLVQEVRFDDEEYDTFMRLLASDVLHSRELRKS